MFFCFLIHRKLIVSPKNGRRSRVQRSNWAMTRHPVSFAYTHKRPHKAVQTWQAQQDTAYFLLIIYSPAQHTLAGTSYRANIYSQHSSISLTKLFSSSVLGLFATRCSGHIGSISQFWCWYFVKCSNTAEGRDWCNWRHECMGSFIYEWTEQSRDFLCVSLKGLNLSISGYCYRDGF